MSGEGETSVESILRGTGLLTLLTHDQTCASCGGGDCDCSPATPSAEALEPPLRRLVMVADGSDPIRLVAIWEGAIRALEKAKVRAPARMVDAALKSLNGAQGGTRPPLLAR